MKTENQIVIYTSPDNHTEVTVKMQDDTVWLTQAQMAELFDKHPETIREHRKNIFFEDELDSSATSRKFLEVRKEGQREVSREIEHYNLDAIISVGYRVNSKRGTAFRIWATQRLREYLVQGYSINQSRLDELGKTIKLLTDSGKRIDPDEAKGLLDIIANYTESFLLLNRYDTGSLGDSGSPDVTYIIDYTEAKSAIVELKSKLLEKSEANDIFGNEKDESFIGILSNIVATFDGQYLYTTIEEQAAHLLYFIIKDHPFTDGNKRIGAFLFIWFLEKNRHRFKKNGEVKINDTGLTTLALLIAQSNPKEKEMMIRLVINLINT
jgi:death-on-curing family protein